MAEEIDPQAEGQPKITGYKKHDQETIDLVNEIKAFENSHGELLAKVADHSTRGLDIDPRWFAIARTHFQEGYMALVRSIFQPESKL